MSIYDVFSGSKPFDKAEWAAQKQAQRKEAYELIDNTCLEMASGGDAFRSYLEVQGRFDRYSVNNAILVSAQMPEATQLKEKAAWKANRVYVNKDARKVIILEPGKEYTRDDGSKAVGYNAKEVYDISQTSAAGRNQTQETTSMRELVAALVDASPVPFVSLWRLWWMQALFPLSPLTTLSCLLFMTVRRKPPLSARGFPSRNCLWAWRRRQRRQSLISSTTRAGTTPISKPTAWRI